jgi:TetR/AcrR family fatty acid metabolism transcriptional regulator
MSAREIPTVTAPVRQSLKERQRLEREELILEAAETLLAEKGYHAMAMDEIATRVGIAKGTVYLHFPSKDDLVVALFERELATFRHVVEDAAAMQGIARVRLEQILFQIYTGIRSGRSQLLITLASDPTIRNELLEKRLALHDHMTQVTTAIQTILEEGKATGELDPTIPTVVMLTTFLGLLSPRSYEPLLVAHRLSPEELVRYVGRIFFTGISYTQLLEK